jgi:hypothetical protein
VNRRLPPGSIVSAAGIVFSSVATTDVITYDGHGLETDDEITLRATEGGTLSAPFVAGTTYYARRISNSTFSIAATAGGAALNITTDGVSMMVTREPNFDDHIEFYSRWADAFIPHAVPLDTVPAIVKGIVADLTAKKILNIAGQDSAILNAAELASKAILERFAKGIPIRDAAVSAPTNLAIATVLGDDADETDLRGWGSEAIP